ncbi:MAG: DUF4177 domain-containing protein [Pseudoxanthomonas suwonensis]|nr:DUF4177 domain-containing protein [Pseudoxanthomonas suwonensis]
MSKRWDYQVIEIKPDMWGRVKAETVQNELKRLGAQGWEVVSFQQLAPMRAAMAVLKRAL